MRERAELQTRAGAEAVAGLARESASSSKAVMVSDESGATGAASPSLETAGAKSDAVEPNKTTGAKTERILPYKTRWAVWAIIVVSFCGCLAAVVLRGGATEWFGLVLLAGIIAVSGLLPIISMIGLKAERMLTSTRIEADEAAQIELRLSRALRNPFVWIAVGDQAKHCNGMNGRTAAFREMGLLYFRSNWTVRYRLAELTRGSYALESVHVVLGDVLGLTAIARTIPCASELLVLPRLPEEGQNEPRSRAGVSRNAAVLGGYGPDTRLYREGDSLRHLDFRSAARGRGWHTKIQRVQSRAELMVVIDQEMNAYEGKDFLFDSCIGWAFHFARSHAKLGHSVTAATRDWSLRLGSSGNKNGREEERELRERLARLEPLQQELSLDRLLEKALQLPAGSSLQIFTCGLREAQRWIELAGRLETMGFQLELYAVAPGRVASFAMREQQKLLEGRGIEVSWLSLLEHGRIEARPQEGGSDHAIPS
ncbi:DUF58 domain-containing protein [Paenibacillus sp. HB172176]|uniref:DUF58 domain-containing protein n=1 Tax=Paenibacillus sp. HB172176 TaxID=2493690 RepID=UPI00143A675E|nr:DUF58 domain-containing protein [Paenibacillus sp. HB172176]